MSKRKRPARSASESSNESADDDAATKDDMVHVSSDMLAGSPEIFAAKKVDTSDVTAPAPEPIEAAAPAAEETAPAPPEDTPPAPAEALEPSAPPAPEPESAPAAPPPFVEAVPYTTPQRRGGSSSTALGIVLVVVGIFAFIVVMAGIDLTQYGWPLFVIIPGVTLLIVGFFGVGSVATVPGGIVTMLGVVLAYQNSTGDWPSWAFAWALVVPFGVGLGMYLQALRDRDIGSLRTGRSLMLVGSMIFIIGFVLFESILGISGDRYGPVGKGALPALLIVIGIILLVRSVQRNRAA